MNLMSYQKILLEILNFEYFFDYISSFYGFNLEKEYKLINFIKKSRPVVIDIGGNKGESIKNFLKFNKI